jgi:hypothetical protein
MIVHRPGVALEALGVLQGATSRSIALSWILPSVWRSQLPSASTRCWQASLCCQIWSPFGTQGRLKPCGRI